MLAVTILARRFYFFSAILVVLARRRRHIAGLRLERLLMYRELILRRYRACRHTARDFSPRRLFIRGNDGFSLRHFVSFSIRL